MKAIAERRPGQFVAVFATAALALVIASWWGARTFGSLGRAAGYLRGERLFVGIPVARGVDPAGTRRYDFDIANYTGGPVRVVGCNTSCSCTTMDRLPLTIPQSSSRRFGIRVTPRPGVRPPIVLEVYTDFAGKSQFTVSVDDG